MAKRIIAVSIISSVLATCIAWGVSYRRNVHATELLQKAEGLLDPPLSQAAVLEEIPAQKALDLLEEAERYGASKDRVRRLREYGMIVEDLKRGALILASRHLEIARRRGWTPDLHVLAAHIERANPKKARFHLQQALFEAPRHARALILAADIACDDRALDECERYLQTASEYYPHVAKLHNRLGLMYDARGQSDRSERAYRRAIALNATELPAYINLARLQSRRGALHEATRLFTKAIELDRLHADAWLGLGLVNLKLQQYRRAEHALHRALELAPRNAAPSVALGDLKRLQKQLAAALDLYESACEKEPRDALSRLKLGNALVESQRFSKALRAFDQAAALSPGMAEAHNGRGVALLALGRFREAADALTTAAKLAPADPNPWLNLSRVYGRLGSYRKAEQAWNEGQTRVSQPLASL